MFGAEFADRYSHFLSNVQDETPFVRSSGTARAVETVHCFKSVSGRMVQQGLRCASLITMNGS